MIVGGGFIDVLTYCGCKVKETVHRLRHILGLSRLHDDLFGHDNGCRS